MMYNMEDEDMMIVDGMHDMERGKFYRKYIMNRFMVKAIKDMPDGLCAQIYDHETDSMDKYYTGDHLADGSVEVSEMGVLFIPGREDIEEFSLHSKMMGPVDSDEQGHHHMMKKMMDEDMDMFHDEDDEGLVILVVNDRMM